MALTDPELDLLRELLEDDPTDEAFLQVGEELVRRGEWAEAEAVLSAGLAAHAGETEGWELLARAALECTHYDLALAALSRVSTAPTTHPQNARVEILALERSGALKEAAARIEAFLAVDPGDVVVVAARERLDAPPPEVRRRGLDPWLTVDRAERYVAVGRVDRAVRVYRRILFHNRDDQGILARLRQLSAGDTTWRQDDLSEELTDPGITPPELQMPRPVAGRSPGASAATLAADEEDTEVRQQMGARKQNRAAPVDEDEEVTDPNPSPIARPARMAGTGPNSNGRKRRRSLIDR